MVESKGPENFEIIIKEGWVEKRSRFVKKWRKRWMVATPRFLFTFKNEKNYKSSPTENIRFSECLSIKSFEDKQKQFVFKLQTKTREVFFSAIDVDDRANWIKGISRLIISPAVMRSVSEDRALNGE
jgi:PH domain